MRLKVTKVEDAIKAVTAMKESLGTEIPPVKPWRMFYDIRPGETPLEARKRAVDEGCERLGLPKPTSYSSLVTDPQPGD